MSGAEGPGSYTSGAGGISLTAILMSAAVLSKCCVQILQVILILHIAFPIGHFQQHMMSPS